MQKPFNRLVRSALMAIVLMVLCHGALLACPNCKDALANDPAQAGLIRGFFWSILLMVSMPFLILGGVGGYFYWEIVRARRAKAIGSPFVSQVPAASDQVTAEERFAAGPAISST